MDLPERNIPTTALIVEKPGEPFILRDVILDEVRSNELLVEMKYVGICHTDLVVQAGKMPLGSFPAVLGHEGAGIIRRLGKGLGNSGLELGDRVILSYSSCLNCYACREGRKGACESIAMINFVGTRANESPIRLPNGEHVRGPFFGQSSFSKLAVVDARSVVKYSGPVEDLAFLAPLGCGYMTGAATVLNVLEPKSTSSLAILGLGAVGLSALMAAKSENIREIIAVDIIESRLQLAASLGATKLINSKDYESIESAIHELLPGGADFIIDTTGLTSIINSGVKALAHGGTFAIVGTPRPQELLEIEALDMLIHCKTLIGVTGGYCDPQQFIPRLIKLFQSGSFPVDSLYKVYPPTQLEEAVEDMKSGEVIKPVLAW
ncbi:chaperonin 10-like protein [Xylogone sp. PMI_703]|nr:chaperonin 10-like protein [Xylogone sp. PMI_703]